MKCSGYVPFLYLLQFTLSKMQAGPLAESSSVASFLPESSSSLAQRPPSVKSVKRKPLPAIPRRGIEEFAPVNNFGFANMCSEDIAIADALRVRVSFHPHQKLSLTSLQMGPGPDVTGSRKASSQVDPLDWPLSSFVREQPRPGCSTDTSSTAPVIIKQASEPRGLIALPPVELGARSLSIGSSSFDMEPGTSCTSAEIAESGTLHARRGRRDAVSGNSISELYNTGS